MDGTSVASRLAASVVLLLATASGTLGQYATLYDAVTQMPQFAFLSQTIAIASAGAQFQDPNTQAILLAPDNAAFTNTLAAFPGAISFATNPDIAKLVLAYHFLPVAAPKAQLVLKDGAALPTYLSSTPNATFLAGTLSKLTFRLLSGNRAYVGGISPGGIIYLNTSITAGKSRIYTLTGALMIPPSKYLSVSGGAVSLTIAELLKNNAKTFSILAALIKADPALKAVANNPDNAVTVFAPTDKAFKALFASLKTTAAKLKGTPLARRIVLNHIIPTRPYAASQFPTTPKWGITVGTAQPGDYLKLKNTGGASPVISIKGGGNKAAISVATPALTVGKSVAYVINSVILPKQNPKGL